MFLIWQTFNKKETKGCNSYLEEIVCQLLSDYKTKTNILFYLSEILIYVSKNFFTSNL